MAASAAVSHPVPAESAWIVGYLRGAGQDAQRQALETYAAWRGREVARWFSDPMPPSTAPERGLTRLWDESTGLDLYAAIAAAGWRRRGGRPPAHTVVFTTTYANLAPGRVELHSRRALCQRLRRSLRTPGRAGRRPGHSAADMDKLRRQTR